MAQVPETVTPDTVARGLAKMALRKRQARKDKPCTHGCGCTAMVESDAAAARCIHAGAKHPAGSGWHTYTTAEQRAYRAEKSGVLARWAAGQTVTKAIAAAMEDED